MLYYAQNNFVLSELRISGQIAKSVIGNLEGLQNGGNFVFNC